MSIESSEFVGFVTVSNAATIENLANKTISIWVNLTSSPPTFDSSFIKKGDGDTTTPGWAFVCDTVGPKLKFNRTVANQAAWSATSTMASGTWYHLGMTFADADTTTNPDPDPEFYFNGTTDAISSTASANASTNVTDTASNITIMGQFNVLWEDLRLINRILSTTEMAILASGYRGPMGGEVLWLTGLDARGLAAINNGSLTSDNVLFDHSGNNNDGLPDTTSPTKASNAPRWGGPTWPLVHDWTDVTTTTVALTGTMASSDIEGSFTNRNLLALTGAVSSIVGTQTQKTSLALTGAVSSIVGTITQKVSLILSGGITPTGAIDLVIKRIHKILFGLASAVGIRFGMDTDNDATFGLGGANAANFGQSGATSDNAARFDTDNFGNQIGPP